MADVDVNFLANPSFVIKNEGQGQVLTIGLGARTQTTENLGVVTKVTQVGWADIILNERYIDMNSPISISPQIQENWLGAGADGQNDMPASKTGKYMFFAFLCENPVHITKMNIRATDANTIPSQIMILTPNLFTGVMDRQIVDVASRKNAYQFQSDIITLDNLDFYLGRNSIIRFAGTFSKTAWETGDAGSAGDYYANSKYPLFIDLTIDRYVSLEKGLIENVKLLSTATGQVSAITQEVTKAEAQANPTLTLNTQDVNPNFNAALQQSTMPNIIPIPTFQTKARR